jgi:hypothetical protein
LTQVSIHIITHHFQAIEADGKRIIISEESGIYKLIIKELNMDDKGKYQAEFTNKAGEKKVASNLNVLCKSSLLFYVDVCY